MFDLMLAARLDDLDRYGTPVGLLIGDLDHFKCTSSNLVAGTSLLKGETARFSHALPARQP
jgi:hypothetical protein